MPPPCGLLLLLLLLDDILQKNNKMLASVVCCVCVLLDYCITVRGSYCIVYCVLLLMMSAGVLLYAVCHMYSRCMECVHFNL